MPYKSKKKQKRAMRSMYRARYAADLAFREAEAARKAAWYALNRERLIAKATEYRQKGGG